MLQLLQHNSVFSYEVAQLHPIQELLQLIRRRNHLIEARPKIEGTIEETKSDLHLKEKFEKHWKVREQMSETVLLSRHCHTY